MTVAATHSGVNIIRHEGYKWRQKCRGLVRLVRAYIPATYHPECTATTNIYSAYRSETHQCSKPACTPRGKRSSCPFFRAKDSDGYLWCMQHMIGDKAPGIKRLGAEQERLAHAKKTNLVAEREHPAHIHFPGIFRAEQERSAHQPMYPDS